MSRDVYEWDELSMSFVMHDTTVNGVCLLLGGTIRRLLGCPEEIVADNELVR